MTQRRKRDRQTGSHAAPAAPAALPKPPAGPAPGVRAGAPPTAGPETSPPAAAGASTSVSLGKLSEAAAQVATSPTAEAVAGLRAELLVSLARAMEIAQEAGDVDLMLKTADRITKALPTASTAAGPAPEPPSGGDHGADDPREPTPAERFRIVSGQVGH